jgi:hypothetical protein
MMPTAKDDGTPTVRDLKMHLRVAFFSSSFPQQQQKPSMEQTRLLQSAASLIIKNSIRKTLEYFLASRVT